PAKSKLLDAGTFVELQDSGPFVPPPDGGVDDAGFAIPVDAGELNSVVGVDHVDPPSGPINGLRANGDRIRVRIFGVNFTPAARVFFDDLEGDTVLLQTTGEISVFVPPFATPGQKIVTVYDELGVGQCATPYTAFAPISIIGPTPNDGTTLGGDSIVLHGAGFTPSMIVTLGGRQVVGLTVSDDTTATFTTPPGEAGFADIVATDAFDRAVLTRAFTYQAPVTLKTVTPNIVDDDGSVVELDGSGFTDDVLATIGPDSAATDDLISDGRMRVVVPSGLVGPQDVSVATAEGAATLVHGLVVRPALTGALALTAAIPDRIDIGGGPVTLVGEGFTGASVVSVGGTAVASFTVVDDRTITFTAPPGSAGATTVSVTAPGGTVSTGLSYFVDVIVSAVSPAVGPVDGGTPVTITGHGFVDPVTVTFGGIPATAVSVVSDSEIAATTPAGAAGFVDVIVHSGGDSGALARGFRFDAPLTVLGTLPSRGSVHGETFVTITGTGFSKGSITVFFGTLEALPTDVTVVSDSTITARTPPSNAIGAVDVSVLSATTCSTGPTGQACEDGSACLGNPNSVSTGEGEGEGEPEPSVLDCGGVATKAFTYTFSNTIVPGVSGGPIEGTISVTVVDFTGNPVPNAIAYVGTDGHPSAAGVTDSTGLTTISGPDIQGPQTITVSANCFGSMTFADVDAAQITAALLPLCGEGEGEGEAPPPAVVTGKVFGFAKEFFDPAALDQSGCPPDGHAPAKCEIAVAQVQTTTASPFGGNPPLLADSVQQVFEEGGSYKLDGARVSNLALIAIAGIFDTNNGSFRFRQLGVRRQVFPQPGVTLDNQDIDLTIALDTSIDISIPDAPIRPADDTRDIGFIPTITRVVPSLGFGGEGFFTYT
ncbi:MAG TPA: IPT/TIG domain-containing protein, partial [Myxococcota bacterium]